MHKTLTLPIQLIFPRAKNTVSIRVRSTGFTLSELLIASFIVSLVIALAGFGLVQVLKANEKNSVEAERQTELNRALKFMVDDIRTAQSVTVSNIPTRSNYQGVFKLTKVENGTQKEFAYYTAPKSASSIWRGPRTVYRQQIVPVISGPSTFALVDAIANIDPTCTSNGGNTGGNKGLKVFIQDSAYIKLCLVGQLNDSRTLRLETQAFTRGRESK